jgi:hypothetical protein
MSAQPYSKIRVDGTEYWMITQPMDEWLKARNIRFPMWTTSNQNGYICEWEIVDDHLWLTFFRGGVNPMYIENGIYNTNYPGATVEKLFDGQSRVIADWFSGTLEIRYGNHLFHSNMGYGQIYEYELWIQIVNGQVIAKNYYDNREFYKGLMSTYHTIDRNEKGPLYDMYCYYKDMRELYYSGKIDAQLNKI